MLAVSTCLQVVLVALFVKGKILAMDVAHAVLLFLLDAGNFQVHLGRSLTLIECMCVSYDPNLKLLHSIFSLPNIMISHTDPLPLPVDVQRLPC